MAGEGAPVVQAGLLAFGDVVGELRNHFSQLSCTRDGCPSVHLTALIAARAPLIEADVAVTTESAGSRNRAGENKIVTEIRFSAAAAALDVLAYRRMRPSPAIERRRATEGRRGERAAPGGWRRRSTAR